MTARRTKIHYIFNFGGETFNRKITKKRVILDHLLFGGPCAHVVTANGFTLHPGVPLKERPGFQIFKKKNVSEIGCKFHYHV